jgi:acid phosphatase type 7
MKICTSHLVVAVTILAGFVAPALRAQEFDKPLGDWIFVPQYRLGDQAENQPGNRVPHPQSKHQTIEIETAPILFHGQRPTQRLQGLLTTEQIPREAFTAEMWICNHVNQPVGALIAAKGDAPGSPVPWTLSFHDWESCLTLQSKDGGSIELKSRLKRWGGFKERWIHLVGVFDGHQATMFVNGEPVALGHVHHENVNWPEKPALEMASYMKNEPFMQFSNLVHAVRIHSRPLGKSEIQNRFEGLKQLVKDGHLYPDLFHYTAGPYLNFATTDSINILWETDRPSRATVQWGTTAELGNIVEIPDARRLQEMTLSELERNRPYFYKITSTSESGEKMDSGLLTFKTAVGKDEPFRFAVLGDTESRPHINDHLAKLIWNERPNFMINLGDLTDAGKKAHRYEWTHEYFVGMTQLTSRIPAFTVPGNGEGDLVWYNHYHHIPKPENFYTFRYGDVAFFMLDSNRRDEEFRPGGKQYVWLEEQLKKCDATWKIACHHPATYTGEEDDYGNSWREESTFGDSAVRQIVPLYEQYGIDLAMFGHLHLYERSHPIRHGKVDFEQGTIHLLAGGGGGNLEDFAPTPAFFSAKTHRGHHYLMIEVANKELTMRMHDTSGAIRDTMRISKIGNGQIRTKRVTNDKP